MIVGSMGLGKSTFVNTLCGLGVIEKRKMGGTPTMEIVPYTVGMSSTTFITEV
jgi:septin family protein